MKTRLQNYFFKPMTAEPLAILRISICLILLLQALTLSGRFFDLFGSSGILQGDLGIEFSRENLPSIQKLLGMFRFNPLEERILLVSVASLYLLSVSLLLLGFHTRFAALFTWGLHMVLVASHPTAYGIDTYAHVFLFYLIVVPCGDALSMDSYRRQNSERKSWQACLGLRLLQAHLCLTYLLSAIEKGSGIQWWNGEAIWRSLMLPLYAQMDLSLLAEVPIIAMSIGWGTLLLEGLYPFMMVVPKTRRIWLPAIISLHMGIFVFLGLQLFGLLMTLLNVSLFIDWPRVLRSGFLGRAINAYRSSMRLGVGVSLVDR